MKHGGRAHITTRVSGIWQTNSVVVSAAGEALVVDPAFFPRELEELSALVRRVTGDGAGSTTVVFTHGHWDHVAGWRHFPGAKVVASAELDRAAAAAVLEADLAYLDALAELAARGDTAGALSMSLPRAETVPDMMDRHRENCQAAGLVIAG